MQIANSSDLSIDNANLEIFVLGPSYGESILIKPPDEDWLVFDCFSLSKNVGPLIFLKHFPNANVSAITISHPHLDHISGIERMIETFPSAVIGCYFPFLKVSRENYLGEKVVSSSRALLGLSAISTAWQDDPQRVWNLFKGNSQTFKSCKVTPLHPQSNLKNKPKNLNHVATPMLVEWNGINILLGSDLEGKAWRDVYKNQLESISNMKLVKIPHHVSKNGLTEQKILTTFSHAIWVGTPFNKKDGLPNFNSGHGPELVLTKKNSFDLTALPFLYDQTKQGPRTLVRGKVKAAATQRTFSSSSSFGAEIIEVARKSNQLLTWAKYSISKSSLEVKSSFSNGTLRITN